MAITKQYLDYEGLSTYDGLLKDYIDSARTLGIKKVTWDATTEQILFFRDSTKSAVADADFKVSISSSAVQALNSRVGIEKVLSAYQSKDNLTEIVNVLTGSDETAGSVAKLLKDAIEALDGSATIATLADGVVTIKAGVVEVDGVIANATGEGAAYTMTDGAVSQADDTKSGFATEGITASYTEATETLVFAAAGTADAVTSVGAVTYTKPVLSGSLPTFGTKTVLIGATVATEADDAATFAGTEADITPELTNGTVTSGVNVNPEETEAE